MVDCLSNIEDASGDAPPPPSFVDRAPENWTGTGETQRHRKQSESGPKAKPNQPQRRPEEARNRPQIDPKIVPRCAILGVRGCPGGVPGHLGGVLGHLGGLWGHHGDVLGGPGSVLEAFWAVLGSSWGPSWRWEVARGRPNQSQRGPKRPETSHKSTPKTSPNVLFWGSGGVLEASRAILGGSWGILGERLGPSWVRLGPS